MDRSRLIPITSVVLTCASLPPIFTHVAAAEKDSVLLGGSADIDGDGNVDLDDYRFWPGCMAGVGVMPTGSNCLLFDLHASDGDVDLRDLVEFQNVFNPPPPPSGDACAQATIINPPDEVFPFNNANATRDGPGHAGCAAAESDQIDKDVWMCWRSPCTGMVVVETCGLSTIDTKIAVYNGCACPVTDERLLACNDDGDVCDVQSRTTFQATTNLRYLIRVGTWPGAPIGGSGSIRIRCGFEACPAEFGNCFLENTIPGCDNAECCNKVCAVDYYCCDPTVFWDATCAAKAEGLCTGDFEACNPVLAGSCTSINQTPGCNDEPCCQAVCRVDPDCCIFSWSETCVEEEAAICSSACENSQDSCFSVHSTPGCNDPACCAEVCPRDPFCCHDQWDVVCTELAGQHCPG